MRAEAFEDARRQRCEMAGIRALHPWRAPGRPWGEVKRRVLSEFRNPRYAMATNQNTLMNLIAPDAVLV